MLTIAPPCTSEPHPARQRPPPTCGTGNGRHTGEQGLFAQEETGFGRITDSPVEAVNLIVRGLPPAAQARLEPLPG